MVCRFCIAQYPRLCHGISVDVPHVLYCHGCFFFSTWIKNANATAVIMVIIGLFFFILTDELEYSKWNIFLNPFDSPSDLSQTVWQNVINQNRLMLVITSVVALLGSMVNLQRREKFV